jgi:hypothetical protein
LKDEIPKLSYLNQLGVPQFTEKKIPSILAADAKHHLLPGSDLWMWAHGLIQTLLEDVPRAHHDYSIITQNWHKQNFMPIYDAVMQSHLKQSQDSPQIWKIMDTFLVVEDPVIEAQQEQIREFIKIYFNSQRNIANHRLRVSAELSPYLVSALCFRSQSDCFNLDIATWEKQTMVLKKEMADSNSAYHRLVTGTMRDIGAHLKENKTILRWCPIWRLCRVDPGRINLAADALAKNLYPALWDKNKVVDEDYLEVRIRMADKASGYRRS